MKWWQIPSNKWLKGYWTFNAFLLGVSLFLFAVVKVPDWVIDPVVKVRTELRHESEVVREVPDPVALLLDSMDARSKIGQLMSIKVEPTSATESGKLIADLKPGFIGLFDIGELAPVELKTIIDSWQQTASESAMPKLVVMVDHEGGRVQRLKNGFTPLPSWEEVCQSQSPDEVRQLAIKTGKELAEVGVTGVWGPVVDRSNPESRVLESRTCSGRVDQLVLMAGAYLDGMSDSGTKTVIKHFPGLGGTKVDPHKELGSVAEADKAVYEQLIDKTDGVMITHVAVGDGQLPCTISGQCVVLLSQITAQDRLIWSDAMEMDGLLELVSETEAAYQAIMAGVDILLYGAGSDPSMQLRVAESLVQSYQQDHHFAKRVDESVYKVLSWKQARKELL